MGDGYIKWIKLLDNDPQQEIITNNQISKPFNLSRGTRQKCPLSPLLFLFTVEPLAMAIRSSPEIKVIIIGEREHSFSLFSDDIVHFLSNLEPSIWALNTLLTVFGEFSGYKVMGMKGETLQTIGNFSILRKGLHI